MKVSTDPRIEEIFDRYPEAIKNKMKFLRQLALETAQESDSVHHLEETLKWGEPSFITNCGSTLRMDWKTKTPNQYALYFQCNSRLVDTFRMVFEHTFQYEGKRAIILPIDQEKIPVEELKECIKAALCYHRVKHLPLLGIQRA